jgi:hypothetical protein
LKSSSSSSSNQCANRFHPAVHYLRVALSKCVRRACASRSHGNANDACASASFAVPPPCRRASLGPCRRRHRRCGSRDSGDVSKPTAGRASLPFKSSLVRPEPTRVCRGTPSARPGSRLVRFNICFSQRSAYATTGPGVLHPSRRP